MKYCFICMVIFATACTTTYYGHTKDEWDNLSEKQQQSIQAEYDKIILYKQQQQHQDRLEDRKQQVIRRGVFYE